MKNPGRDQSAWISRTLGINGIPSARLIGPDGKIISKEIDAERLDETIKTALDADRQSR